MCSSDLRSLHIQSLIIALIFAMIGAMLFAVALLADLIANNRRLVEENLYRTKKIQYFLSAQIQQQGQPPTTLMERLIEPEPLDDLARFND